MDKKGFTLVELLGVIVILGVLALIVTISVQSVLKNSKNSLSDIQIIKIEEAAESYYLQEGINNSFYELDEIRSCVNVSYLSEEGYLDSGVIKDPKDSEEMQGSVKITYKSNNYSFEYQENACSDSDLGIICVAVDEATTGSIPEGKYEAGDEYICEVKPNTKYRFFVLGEDENDSSKVNLIMYSNINSDGTPSSARVFKENAVNGVYSSTSWVNSLDYGCLDEEGDSYGCAHADKGPISAINFLNNATKSWTYLPNLNELYSDKYNFYKNFKLTGKARMPKLNEMIVAGCTGAENSCPKWIFDNLDGTSTYVYLTMDAYDNNGGVMIITSGGFYHATGHFSDFFFEIRPVISVPKDLIK